MPDLPTPDSTPTDTPVEEDAPKFDRSDPMGNKTFLAYVADIAPYAESRHVFTREIDPSEFAD